MLLPRARGQPPRSERDDDEGEDAHDRPDRELRLVSGLRHGLGRATLGARRVEDPAEAASPLGQKPRAESNHRDSAEEQEHRLPRAPTRPHPTLGGVPAEEGKEHERREGAQCHDDQDEADEGIGEPLGRTPLGHAAGRDRAGRRDRDDCRERHDRGGDGERSPGPPVAAPRVSVHVG